MTGLACIDCHMAEATKSASSKPTTGWGRRGDVKTHIFKISTSPTATNILRTNADGKIVATNYLTVKYTCGKCHDSAAGGTAHQMTEADALSWATGYHSR